VEALRLNWPPECWIVDLTARVVEVYSGPSSGGYASQRTAAPGEVLRAIAVPELELAITDLLPPTA
jgi:Uma2 family endonuclease